MNDAPQQNVTLYLNRLETELTGVPVPVRDDILAGIREELLGLSPQAADDRMREMGDPAFIAAEARREAPGQANAVAAAAPGRASSIAAVIVLIAGSIVAPGIGALVGLVWISTAQAWTRREKLTAWLVPAGVAVVVAALSLILVSVDASGSHIAVLLGYLVFPIVGAVLAVRAQRRDWYPRSVS